MKLFKKPTENFSKFRFALIHALIYSGIVTIVAFILLLILNSMPSHLALWEDWLILMIIVILIFIIVFVYVFLDEIYIEKKYLIEKNNERSPSSKKTLTKNNHLENSDSHTADIKSKKE